MAMLGHWRLLEVNTVIWECQVVLAMRLGPRGLVFVKAAVFGQSRGYWTTLAGPVCLLRVLAVVLVIFQHLGAHFGEGKAETQLLLTVMWWPSATGPGAV